MDRLRALIEDNLDKFPDFDYYLPLVEKAKQFEESRPDTAIECCNSLFQGISKTIILSFETGTTLEDLDKPSEAKSDKLIKRALRCLKENDDIYEDDFCTRGASLAFAVATLRNARGDVSHGKAVPKQMQSDRNLARVSNEMSESLLCYMLASFFAASSQPPLEAPEPVETSAEFDIEYDDNPDFNDFLDEQYPLPGKMLYSEALFLSYIEEYQIELDAYQDGLEEEVS